MLVDAVCAALEPALAREGARYVDLTLGGGGHAREICTRFAPARVWAFDRDREALAAGGTALQAVVDGEDQLELVHAPFSQLRQHMMLAAVEGVDAILADLGVSSHQLDAAGRGFSFRGDAPLDMRMDRSRGHTAAELLDELELDELTAILRDYGQEPDARRIAQAIYDTRPRTTFALAQTVRDAMSARQLRKLGRRVNPATRTFQALRIAVNREFDELDTLLAEAPELLRPGGRLAVITFHSLEDGRVKSAFRRRTRVEQPPAGLPVAAADLPQADFVIPRGLARGVDPTPEETKQNPRARSARLRVLERRTPPA